MSMTAPVLTPPLREDERLTRDEFLRRWEAMPDLKWAELIDGIVHMPSPISTPHGDYHGRMFAWLAYYVADTCGCRLLPATTWLMSEDSAPQPDIALCIRPERGGQSREEGIYSAGAPELIVEISHTTITRDAGVKLRLYERNGVKEYLIVRPEMKQVIWRELSQNKYLEIAPGADGILRSRVFPGLWLETRALWDGNYAGLAAIVQQGLATPEHAEFVRKLESAKS
jgi:Uma2 family endonuclease